MTWLPGGHNDWFSVSTSEPTFRLRFNRRASALYKNFDYAADDAAKILHQEWGNKPLYLAMSGGIDSELAARILIKNNIPFTPVILKIDKLNHYETWYAEYWCNHNKVKPIILNYSLDDYLKEMLRLGPNLHKIKNHNMTPILLIYEYVHNLDGHCIYCGGDINFDSKSKLFFCASLDFISNILDVGNHPTSFFMYTPELALSYVNQFDINQTEQYNKLKFYQVSPRPKIDYLSVVEDTKQFQEALNRIFYLFGIEHSDLHKQKHWYGTKEQIIQELLP